jgi:hypothetical protein
MPTPPGFEPVIPAADTHPGLWHYTTAHPADNWFAVDFDASAWSQGKGGFGRTQNPTAVVNTAWITDDIWLRREVELTASQWDELLGWLSHDDDAEVYLNGVLAIKTVGATSAYEDFPFSRRGRTALKPGKNVIAIHCRNTGGEQYIDFGLVKAKAQASQ